MVDFSSFLNIANERFDSLMSDFECLIKDLKNEIKNSSSKIDRETLLMKLRLKIALQDTERDLAIFKSMNESEKFVFSKVIIPNDILQSLEKEHIKFVTNPGRTLLGEFSQGEITEMDIVKIPNTNIQLKINIHKEFFGSEEDLKDNE